MIRKLADGRYRLYSRKLDPRKTWPAPQPRRVSTRVVRREAPSAPCRFFKRR